MQSAADAAALYGAQQLSVGASTGLSDRAIAVAQKNLTGANDLRQLTIAPQVSSDGASMTVAMSANRASFFANLLPPGGWSLGVSATANAARAMPLCVLVFGDMKGDMLALHQQSTMSAPQCLVHSNQNIQVDNQAQLSGEEIEAVGKAAGPISPAAQTGAPTIDDPFLSANVDFPSPCTATNTTKPAPPNPLGGVPPPPAPGAPNTTTITSSTTLPAGTICTNVAIQNGAVVTLAPGEHYFGGNVTVSDTSQIVGDDVVLDFDMNSVFNFLGSSSVSLNGRRSGPLAGFVIVTSRDNTHPFVIESDHVSNLHGTVYLPNATLQVTGTSKVAQSSPWTVITALAVQLQGTPNGSPQLVINSQYSSSTVPVPTGVGPRNGSVTLTQ